MAKKAVIGIAMGSDSDLPLMKEAAEVLTEFRVAFEIKIVSAHRTPDEMSEYGKSARSRGLKVIIAGAGGAAHLPGMLAAYTTLPVVGVPVPSKNLLGVDSLYSIVQMPFGVPVASVAIGGAKNAALLALQILSTSDPSIAQKLEQFRTKQAHKSRAKNTSIGK